MLTILKGSTSVKLGFVLLCCLMAMLVSQGITSASHGVPVLDTDYYKRDGTLAMTGDPLIANDKSVTWGHASGGGLRNFVKLGTDDEIHYQPQGVNPFSFIIDNTSEITVNWANPASIYTLTYPDPGSSAVNVAYTHSSGHWDKAQTIIVEDATAAGITNLLTMSHNTSGTPAADIGGALRFEAETSTTPNEQMGQITQSWTNVTHASRDADMSFKLVVDGSAIATWLRLFDDTGVDRIWINDDYRFTAGEGDDLEWYHNATDSVIANNTGNLDVTLGNGIIEFQQDTQLSTPAGPHDVTVNPGQYIIFDPTANQIQLQTDNELIWGGDSCLTYAAANQVKVCDGDDFQIGAGNASTDRLMLGTDIELYRSTTDTLRLGDGDGIIMSNSSGTATKGNIHFNDARQRLEGDGGNVDSITWWTGQSAWNARENMYIHMDTDGNCGSAAIHFDWGPAAPSHAIDENGTNLMKLTCNGGLTVGTPTGGQKGVGTINVSSAYYVNNTALTVPDWVFEMYFLGSAYPDRELYTLEETSEAIEEDHSLPWITAEDPEEGINLSGTMMELWQGQEQQQIYIMELEERIATLEALVAGLVE